MSKHFLDISELPPKLMNAVAELKDFLRFELSNGGIEISANKGEENRCELFSGKYTVTYKRESYFFRALKNLAENDFRDFNVVESCVFEDMEIMLDCSRNGVYTVEAVKKLIRLMSLCGYTALQLYTEDTYEVDNEPYFGYLRGRYSGNELKEIVKYADMFGIEVIPCIQTLAHLGSIFKCVPYSKALDINDILLVGADRTYELLENIFATLAQDFTSRRVNIGMDEAHMCGLGEYLNKNGIKNRFDILLSHLNKVIEIAEKYGFTCSMWSDMFFRLAFSGQYGSESEIPKEVIAKIPKNIELFYWNYYITDSKKYDEMLKKHLQLGNKIGFAGGCWTWSGFAPINSFGMQTQRAAIESAEHCSIGRYVLTAWGDDGAECSVFSALPTIVFVAERAYKVEDEKQTERAFRAISGCDISDFMLLDYPNKMFNAEGFVNPSKYMFYSDCFLGFLDAALNGFICDGEKVKRLASLSRNREWGYLFSVINKLCEVLKLKTELGAMTRELYARGDKVGLKKLADENYRLLIGKLKSFYRVYERYWTVDKKPNGFDVQDIRLGGLIQRVSHCRERLDAFACGKISKIEELEEKLLDFNGNGDKITKGNQNYNGYIRIATINCFSHGVL